MRARLRKRLAFFSMQMLAVCGTMHAGAQETATGPSTHQTPYVQPLLPGYKFTSILSANDSIGGYAMAGTPDGLGAFDNGNGTFTLLMNHEFVSTVGGVRAHGSKGAFVSKWIIRKSDLAVQSGSDLIQNVKLWNGTGYDTYNAANPSTLAAFNRFCSADLPAVSAFYNSATGNGTQERIFMNGEENGEGRAMAHIVTGAEAGTTYQMPGQGKMAFENQVANPHASDVTIVGLTDDASITTGNVYFYVGTKTNTGSDVDKAGLTNGKFYGVKISGFSIERTSSSFINNPPAPGTHFDLVDLGDVKSLTGAQLDAASATAGVTYFSRPEDAAWDPSHLADFYFNTTDQIDQVNDGVGTQVGRSRVWRLRFTDLEHPELGGTVEAVLDGTEGQVMLDNMAIDKNGHIILLEDVGNSAHNGKVWDYNIATDVLTQIAKHDVARFGDINIAATAPFNQDEETSGVIDVQDILGKGKYLLVDQSHYNTGIPLEIVEGGQLMSFSSCPASYSFDTVTACLNYKWNGVVYEESGTYTYTTTNAAGCDSIATLVLTVYPVLKPKKPVVVASENPIGVCPGDTITLTTVGTYPTYEWNTGETTQSIAVTTSGKYNVTITSADNGCVRTSDNTVVSYNVCKNPAGASAANITSSSATLSWAPSTCAEGYKLQYKANGATEYTTITISSADTTSYILGGLAANTRYEWEVATICSVDPLITSNFSAPKTFKTLKADAVIAEGSLSSVVGKTGTFHISVSPNPAASEAKVFVSGANSYSITVTDLSGKVYWKNASAQGSVIAIPAEKLINGTYIITVQSGAAKATAKLVIAK